MRDGDCARPRANYAERDMKRYVDLIGLSISPEELAMMREEYEEQRPDKIPRLIGSRQWIERQERIAAAQRRRFVPMKALRRAYRSLTTLEVVRINAGADTVYGKELDHDLINRLELTIALYHLPETPRTVWLLHACEGMEIPAIADELGRSEAAIQSALTRAGNQLVERIFEPLEIVIFA